MLFQKGQNIDTYTVVFPHKEGSYAETYRVRNSEGKLRFLKLIYYSKLNKNQIDENGNIIEIEVAKQLKHRNLCRFENSGKIISSGQNLAYFVTEFVSSETLDKRILRDGDLSVFETKEIAKAILSALQYIHNLKVPIIHNEITVQNILLNLSGELQELKLIDFGNARFLNQKPAKPDLKEVNPFYLAPERFNGVCCAQSDLYSVGVLIYNLLFGSLPWFFDVSGKTFDDISDRLLSERSKGVRLPNIEMFELDENLLNSIAKALQNDIADRFQTAEEFIKAIDGEVVITTKNTKRTKNDDCIESPSKPKGSGFKDVAGMEDLKDQLQKSVINILKNTEKAKKYRLTIPNGMLLYGPPGCGKSFFAEKFAEETGYNYIYVKSSDLASIYVHGSQEKIAKLFDEARQNAPTILCFDEFDSLVPSRNNLNNASQSGEVNEFLSQLNNCGQDGVFIIASTNKPDLIDSAVLRRGRIDKIVYLPVPDRKARAAMFELHLLGRPFDFGIDYGKLADMTENYVSSDIAFIVNESAMYAAENDEKITQRTLEKVISQNKPSVSPSVLKHYEDLKAKLEGFTKETPKNRIGFN